MFPVSTKGGGICFAFPDVCLVPAAPSPVPTPLPNIGQCRDAVGTVGKVLADHKEVLVESSTLPMSSGDEAGTGGGVISGLCRGSVSFKSASGKVYAKGKRVIIHTAVSAHNGSNANIPVGMQVSASQGKVIAAG